MKIEKKLRTNIIIYAGILIVGIILGWLIFGKSGDLDGYEENAEQISVIETSIWTCSMHPQIRQNAPGSCPICGMDLIPMESGNTDDDAASFSVKLSEAAMKIAEVELSKVERRSAYKDVYLPGKVMVDERNIIELTARFPGRIEKLLINYTGQKVKKGEVLAKIYSPELVTAQKELFEAVQFKSTTPSYYNASKNKLKLWDLTDEQISNIEKSGEVIYYFDVLSPISGTVTKRHIAHGDYVEEGTQLFQVIDLSHLWVMFDAYESDLPWIKLNEKVQFMIKSIPGRQFQSTVTFIDPVLNPMSRVVKVRTELHNPQGLLKPEMLAEGILKSAFPGSEDQLIIPKSAVLWTGKKAVVYILTDDHNNMFEYREIELGPEAGEYYIIMSGLEEGEIVASNGVFKIDAATQLSGKMSMMNPEGGKMSIPHNHGGMKMEGGQEKSSSSGPVPEIFKNNLLELLEIYFGLKNALVSSDMEKSSLLAGNLLDKVKTVDMKSLDEDNHEAWMKLANELQKNLNPIFESGNLEEQRRHFSLLSSNIIHTINLFNLEQKGHNLYIQYCPMAVGDNGAYWLSEIKEIRNPYFGEAMLKCGETRDSIISK